MKIARPAMSKKMERYFDSIIENVNNMYEIANRARKKGIDPTTEVECPPAHDMAGRVENLVGPKGVADRIRKLKENGLDQDQITFKIADDIIDGKLGKFNNDQEKVDRAIRVALAIKTEGVVSAPLEGISKIIIRNNALGGEDYLSIYFAGPIRAAGGTVQAFCVLIGDYVREKMKIARWKGSEDEIGRIVEEVKLYDRIVNLQYPSTQEELEFAARNLRIELNGDPTERVEVSAYRDMKRIDTNFVRSGPCLVLNDGVLLKSKKIMKVIDKMKIPGWEWLKEIKKYSHSEDDNKKKEAENQKEGDYGSGLYDGKAEKKIEIEKEEDKINSTPVIERRKKLDEKVPPVYKYIADVIGGRPVFSYPSEIGGHRIRYGRSRNTGLAACGMNPNTMYLLNEFLAVGTQIRIERPGKSASVMPVTSIEGPVCLHENGDVVQYTKANSYKKIKPENPIKEFLWIGDMSFGFGEFAENNHVLLPSGYVEEWWVLDLEKALINGNFMKDGKINEKLFSTLKFSSVELSSVLSYFENPFRYKPNGIQALEISKKLKIPLHPYYLHHYGNANGYELIEFRNNVKDYYYKNGWDFSKFKKLKIPNIESTKNFLYKIFCPHKNEGDFLEIAEDLTKVFIEIYQFSTNFETERLKEIEEKSMKSVALEMFELLTEITIKDKSPYYMGTRMGRPEKAKERKMKPPVNVLFPMGHNTGNNRIMQKAVDSQSFEVDIVLRECLKCNKMTYSNKCEQCGTHTEIRNYCRNCNKSFPITKISCDFCSNPLLNYQKGRVDFTDKYNNFMNIVKTNNIPDVKGVKGLSSLYKMPEPIEKGILRALNDVWVFKDGTIRFDALDIPFTHFTPKEIGTSIVKLNEMGYDCDYLGENLTDENQICELKVQDFIATEHCGDYFIRVSNFVDDELEYLYDLPRFYNCKQRNDLIGHYFAGLAPHTSAAIVGRCIGFTPITAGYGHPYWHAAKRRNCFPNDAEILISIDGNPKQALLKDIYDNYFENEIYTNKVWSKNKNLKDIKVYSYDKENHKVVLTNIVDVIKAPTTDHLIKFNLKSGRSITTTPDHLVTIIDKDKIIEKKAFEIKPHDKFIIPKLDILERDISHFDLLFEFKQEKYKNIQNIILIRGIRLYIKELIEIKGLTMTAELLKIEKNTLQNYYSSNDSIPLNILIELTNLYDIELYEIPNCLIGFEQDNNYVPRYIKLTKSLMKLIGYYLADGLYRKQDEMLYQVDLVYSENDIREDVLNSIQDIFKTDFNPNINENRITVTNRVLYLFFKEILKLSNIRRSKSIPDWILNLPLEKIKYLISAYYSVNGVIDKNGKTIVVSSLSEELLENLDFLLLRFGIFGSFSKCKHETVHEYDHKIMNLNIQKFAKSINFTTLGKRNSLIEINLEENTENVLDFYGHWKIGIKNIEIVKSKHDFVYSLNAEKYHTILINKSIVTHQCDGDEDGLLLLLDLLLNFSRYYLPAKIGGKMDAPLVLSVTLDPNEVDGEAHNVDGLAKYPIEFYEKTLEYAKPYELEKKMGLLKERLGKSEQYEGIKFNLPTKNINYGPKMSSYKLMETMDEKIESQVDLAVRIKAVDAEDVVKKILKSHFTPDILGNLRSFGQQGFRCSCGQKYRRMPLIGKCTKCGKDLIMTVSKGGITKYLEKSLDLCNRFDLGNYTKQRFILIDEYVKSLTDNPKVKQVKITSFFK